MWREFLEECSGCQRCKEEGLLYPRAFPVMMRVAPRTKDILFILEAPNRDDTYNPNKKHLTVEPDTDPSGKFFYDLFVNELRFCIKDLFVTNSVLCLPVKKNGKYPVSALQQKNCSDILRRMIDIFKPLIVCPVGGKALIALRRIQNHCHVNMADAVAKPTPWYGRILFPLYHTSAQARNPRNGRIEVKQRSDWRKLRRIWEKVKP